MLPGCMDLNPTYGINKKFRQLGEQTSERGTNFVALTLIRATIQATQRSCAVGKL